MHVAVCWISKAPEARRRRRLRVGVVLPGSIPLSLAAPLLRGSSWGTTPPTFGDTHSVVWMETQPEVGMTQGEMEDQHRGDIGDE